MKTIDEINDEFKNLAIARNNLINEFLDDLKEIYEDWYPTDQYIKKWEAKKNEGLDKL